MKIKQYHFCQLFSIQTNFFLYPFLPLVLYPLKMNLILSLCLLVNFSASLSGSLKQSNSKETLFPLINPLLQQKYYILWPLYLLSSPKSQNRPSFLSRFFLLLSSFPLLRDRDRRIFISRLPLLIQYLVPQKLNGVLKQGGYVVGWLTHV